MFIIGETGGRFIALTPWSGVSLARRKLEHVAANGNNY
jgi:hypothetical protein